MLRTAWRNLRVHKLRLVLSGVAIVLGVGFVAGTLIFTDTLNRTFTDLFTQTVTDVVVTPVQSIEADDAAGATLTLPSDLLDKVSAVAGVDKAAGQVFLDGVTIIDPAGEPVGQAGPPQFGSNWEDDERLTPYRLQEGAGPTGPGEVAIDSVSAEKAGYQVGDTVSLVTPQGQMEARLTGIFRFGTSGNLAGATITAFDTATAQDVLLNGKSAYTEIDALATAGVSQTELADRVRAVVGDGVKVQTGQEAADQQASDITSALSFINIFLLVFAGIALFVGIFTIINTFSMLVAQRARELALLRALGATRRQVRMSVLIEAFFVGVLGSALGVALGVAVAFGLQAFFKAFGAEIPTNGLVLLPRTLIVGMIVGVLVTLVAALFPAFRASRIPPMAALREDVALPRRGLKVRAILGAVFVVLGIVAMFMGASSGGGSGASLVGLGTVITLVGAIVLSPAIAGPIVRVLGGLYPRLFGTVGRLALENAQRQPRRTAATASALMIGLALVSALTVFATSTKTSVTQAVDRVFGAEFLIMNQAQRPFPATVATAVRETTGVASVSAIKYVPAEIDGAGAALTGVDPSTVSDAVNLEFDQGSMADLTASGILTDSATADSLGLAVGDKVEVALPTGTKSLQLVGTYSPEGGVSGWVISNQALADAGLELGDSVVYVTAAPDADLTTVHTAIDDALSGYPTVEVQSQAEFKDQIVSSVNQVLLFMVMLLSLAILIAVLGIVNTLVLSVIERTREIGMLRAIGALRMQIRRLVVLEALVISVYGAVIGLVLGLAFATALQRTLVDQGIEVLDIPWLLMIVFLVIAGMVGVLAALWPAFRAGRLDVLQAVSE